MALQWRGDEKAQFNRSNCARFAITVNSRRVNWTELWKCLWAELYTGAFVDPAVNVPD